MQLPMQSFIFAVVVSALLLAAKQEVVNAYVITSSSTGCATGVYTIQAGPMNATQCFAVGPHSVTFNCVAQTKSIYLNVHNCSGVQLYGAPTTLGLDTCNLLYTASYQTDCVASTSAVAPKGTTVLWSQFNDANCATASTANYTISTLACNADSVFTDSVSGVHPVFFTDCATSNTAVVVYYHPKPPCNVNYTIHTVPNGQCFSPLGSRFSCIAPTTAPPTNTPAPTTIAATTASTSAPTTIAPTTVAVTTHAATTALAAADSSSSSSISDTTIIIICAVIGGLLLLICMFVTAKNIVDKKDGFMKMFERPIPTNKIF